MVPNARAIVLMVMAGIAAPDAHAGEFTCQWRSTLGIVDIQEAPVSAGFSNTTNAADIAADGLVRLMILGKMNWQKSERSEANIGDYQRG